MVSCGLFWGMVSILVKTLVYILSELERFLQKQYEVVGKCFFAEAKWWSYFVKSYPSGISINAEHVLVSIVTIKLLSACLFNLMGINVLILKVARKAAVSIQSDYLHYLLQQFLFQKFQLKDMTKHEETIRAS